MTASEQSMFSERVVIVIIALCAGTLAEVVQPIWLSPINTNYDRIDEYAEQIPEKGVWSTIPVGAGARSGVPILLKDSKGTLWIMFGTSRRTPTLYMQNVWNYDPKKDLYRWVAGPGNSSTSLRNPGELGVPSPDNFPGNIASSTATIDRNDNIWFTSFSPCCELWMFNTTSFLFTRMQGNSSADGATDPNYGTVPGQPGPEVSPGEISGGCFVTDSTDNLWLISGYDASSVTNRVWHFNKTSMLWTFISGNDTIDTLFTPEPYFGGRTLPGCEIDENDKVWLFGGEGSAQGYFDFSDMWSFDTRTKQWQLEFGSDANRFNGACIVSSNFSAKNYPSAKRGAALVNRNDGTLIVVGGGGYDTSHGSFGGQNDIWLFNKTSKEWKLIYGDPTVLNFPGNFSHYRTPGSALAGRFSSGRAHGLNIDGDVFIVGGDFSPYLGSKEIWLVPYDQCTNSAHKCSVDAQCIEEMVGYSCECNQGFIGDGFTCIADSSAPGSINEPSSSSNPSVSTPSKGPSITRPSVVSGSTRLGISDFVLLLLLFMV